MIQIKIDSEGLPELPKVLTIGAHKIQIIYPYTFVESNDKTGMANHSNDCIYIAGIGEDGEALSPVNILVTAIHEVLHIFERICGSDIFHDENGNELDILNAWAEAIAAFLLLNGYISFEEGSHDDDE